MTHPPRRRIQFLELLGRGGFGAVYLADVRSREDFVQRMAVKVLTAEPGAAGAPAGDVAARQRDEARLLAQINCDHIVKVFDLIDLDGRPAVLMEYVEGADAAALLNEGPLPPRAAAQVAAAAASALDAAWGAISPVTGRPLQVVHRDIKPANLLISRHGAVKVLDFGVARADFDREGVTRSEQYGTARYMAPERWLSGESGPAVDVYALGVTALELLTGRLAERAPLQEPKFEEHVQALLRRLPPWAMHARWREEMLALLRAMLAYEGAKRPTAAEVHDRLLALSEDAPGESLPRYARRVVPTQIQRRRQRFAADALPGEVSFTTTMAATASAPPAPARSRFLDYAPLLALGALAVGALLLGGVGVRLVSQRLDPAGEQVQAAVPADPAASPSPSPVAPALAEGATPAASVVPDAIPALAPPAEPSPASEREAAVQVSPPPQPPREALAAVTPAPPPAPAPAPEPEKAAKTWSIAFGSAVGGTAIYVDEVRLARGTPTQLALTEGSHRLRMERGEQSAEATIEVGEGRPSRYMLTLDGDEPRIEAR